MDQSPRGLATSIYRSFHLQGNLGPESLDIDQIRNQ